MPKKGKGKKRAPQYQLKHRALFASIIEAAKPPALTRKTHCGFRLRNVDQLWRWDTLEDVTY